MSDVTTTETDKGRDDKRGPNGKKPKIPGLLVAYTPETAVSIDRVVITESFTVGRDESCSFRVGDEDKKISRRHFRIYKEQSRWWIEDLGSTNHTYVNGEEISTHHALTTSSVVRSGNTVFVFHEDVTEMLNPPPNRYGFVGTFHVENIIEELQAATLSSRHILLTGPSGAGKELAARALATMMSETNTPLPILAHNAARFSSEEEAKTTMFGVAPRTFSNVDARPGLIEQAGSGVLFIDEVHSLPENVQRSLLRVIEDGQTARIGKTETKRTDVRFVLASNAIASLTHDLLKRLRILRIPSLKERIADIPSLFRHLVSSALKNAGLDDSKIVGLLDADHYEELCLDGFDDDNVRGLIDLADKLVTYIVSGKSPADAILKVFDDERFGDLYDEQEESVRGHDTPVAARHLPSQVERPLADNSGDGSPARSRASTEGAASEYELNKDKIVDAYIRSEGNISGTQRLLHEEHKLSLSRRYLTKYARQWKLPHKWEFS